MSEKHRIGSVIICDDVRTEVTGKETLVGVYNGVLVVPTVPHAMTKLCFRMPLYAERKVNANARFQIIGPANQKLAELSGDMVMEPSDPGYGVPIGMAIGNLVLPAFGEYDVRFVLGTGKPKSICRFLVRQPRRGEQGFVEATPTKKSTKRKKLPVGRKA